MRSVQRLLIVLSLFTTVVTSGQQNQRLRDRDPDLASAKSVTQELQQARFHYGPFYLLSRFRLSDIGYTGSFGVPTTDTTDTLAIAVEAPQRLYFVPHKKVVLTGEVVPAYNVFVGGDRDGQFDFAARADAHLLTNHLYLNAYTLLSDQLRAHVSDVNRLATSETSEYGVGGEFKYSSRTRSLFSVRRSDVTYPGDRFQPDAVPMNLLDRSDTAARASLIHRTFPLTSLFVSGEVSDHSFDRATYKDSRRTWTSAGALYETGRTQFRVEAGPLKLDFEDPAEADYSGVGANASVRRRNGRWLYDAGVERDLGFSILAGNNFYVTTGASAGVDYDATRRLALHGGVAWQQDEYPQPRAGEPHDVTMLYSRVGFSYTIRRLVTGLDLGWYERESSVLEEKDSGIRLVVRLSFTP